MKGKIIMPIALILLVGLSIFVFARTEGENLDGSVHLGKGWNLVTIYATTSWLADDWDFQGKDIRAAFFYNRYKREYIRVYPNKEKDKLNDFREELSSYYKEKEGTGLEEYRREYGGLANSAQWLYSNKDQTLNFRTLDGPVFPEHVGLWAGWNFLSITPEMIDKSLNDVKGSCGITKAAVWTPQTQTWDVLSETEMNEGEFDNNMLWLGLVVKVSNDCTMGEVVIEPPTLP